MSKRKKKKKIICPLCKGTGHGTGSFEQGGMIRGLCPKCNGYGHWYKE